MKKLHLKFSFFLLSTCFFFDAKAGREEIEAQKPAVVSITVRQTTRAYGSPQTSYGTGFLADKEKGIIITNRHVASTDCPASFEASWENGKTTDLKLLWNDPTNDFSFMQIDPSKIPSNVPQVTFSTSTSLGQDVFMIGNNAAIGHSMQMGTINDLFSTIATDWQKQGLSISLNSKGGSSGSPVFNDEGQIIGVNCSSSDTNAYSVPISYVQDALQNILENKIPLRFSTGAIFSTINLDHAQDYFGFNAPHMQEYLDTVPGSRNRLLAVDFLLPTLNQPLEVGDIIEKVNGINVGPNQYLVEKALNETKSTTAKFKVNRNGDSLDLDIPIFDLNETLCSEMLVFGNTVFATVDPLMSFQTGMPIGSVCIGSKSGGSLFDDLPSNTGSSNSPLVMVKKIDGKPIHKLRDVIIMLPEITKKEKFNYLIKDYGINYLNNTVHTIQKEHALIAYYRPHHYPQSSLIKFDNEKHDWVRETVGQ